MDSCKRRIMMKLEFMTTDIEEFLQCQNDIINFNHPIVQSKIKEINKPGFTAREKAEKAFNYVRDEIQHSFDTNSLVITISASDTIEKGEGICFAKSHLLTALLRGMGIPAGFCYQRVLRKGTIESGYALHGLNAVYIEEEDQWIRVDPRGNKPGIYSEFSVDEEKLAYPIREELGEKDYPQVFPQPLETVIHAMQHSEDCHELFLSRPESI